ncbi:GDSL esterase/lipase At5g22810-like [Medicago truncatula]|uniref:GDSL esterase/lipase At5g22810-like n=1 Tax=Medicago truncatula TaxID=3880 RepID=UPI001966D2EF|nr:GDSL esterase/lipase At5g22810-like [Medicago truncatula]
MRSLTYRGIIAVQVANKNHEDSPEDDNRLQRLAREFICTRRKEDWCNNFTSNRLYAIITKFGYHPNKRVERINNVALDFNKKLNFTTENLIKKHPDVKLVIFDIYQPLYQLIIRPSDYGLFEARKGCCGTGLLEVAILCNKISIGTCADASKYVFWDSFHPTEAINKIMMDHLIPAATSLLYSNQTVR